MAALTRMASEYTVPTFSFSVNVLAERSQGLSLAYVHVCVCVSCSPLAICKFLSQTAQKAKNPAELLLCTSAACLTPSSQGGPDSQAFLIPSRSVGMTDRWVHQM